MLSSNMSRPGRAFLASAAIVLAAWSGAAGGDVFKCVDDAGQLTYQATDCEAGEGSRAIDVRYSNVGSLALEPESKAILEEIHREREARARRTISRRDAALDEAISRQSQSEAECARLKDEVQALYIKRRYHRVDRDARDDLVRQMRATCAP